jgi:hypothetical protein
MDIDRVIRDLNEERKRLERIIESLEAMAKSGTGYLRPPSRRGRKFMDSAGRQEVSERMKRYWARRREERSKAAAPDPDDGGVNLPINPVEQAAYA